MIVFSPKIIPKSSGILLLLDVNKPILYNRWKRTPKIIQTPIRYIFGSNDSKYYIYKIPGFAPELCFTVLPQYPF